MATNRSKILDKAKKLKELADRGIDGEMANAKVMLWSYMQKHNINLDEIQNHTIGNDSKIKFMTDDEFLDEVTNDLLSLGLGWVICFLLGGNTTNYKDAVLNEMSKKYMHEIEIRTPAKSTAKKSK